LQEIQDRLNQRNLVDQVLEEKNRNHIASYYFWIRFEIF
jgi:hypothetical protein